MSRMDLIGLAAALFASTTGQAFAAVDRPPAMLPDRLLECSVGHVTNFDPSTHDQTADELAYDGWHSFALYLPAIAAPQGPPPDPTEAAAPVDPRTRILRDPDHISGQPSEHFGRIVDMWPKRVELSAPLEGDLLNAIVIAPIDLDRGVANLFMMRASELTHWQKDHIYQGTCRITSGELARNAVRPGI